MVLYWLQQGPWEGGRGRVSPLHDSCLFRLGKVPVCLYMPCACSCTCMQADVHMHVYMYLHVVFQCAFVHVYRVVHACLHALPMWCVCICMFSVCTCVCKCTFGGITCLCVSPCLHVEPMFAYTCTFCVHVCM